MSTFHALGAEVARQELFRLGWPKRFAVADAGDQMALVRRLMRSVRVDGRALDARRVVAAISRAKNAGGLPASKPDGQDDDYDVIAAEVFPLYQRALRAQGAVDFDDLILLPLQLFREYPEVLARWRKRFTTLLVDEFQDTNPPQFDFVRLLAGKRQDLCVVGDDDQCIYSWRGAEVRNILEFHLAFPGTREVVLERNYRSTAPVLAAASAVIGHAESTAGPSSSRPSVPTGYRCRWWCSPPRRTRRSGWRAEWSGGFAKASGLRKWRCSTGPTGSQGPSRSPSVPGPCPSTCWGEPNSSISAR